MASERSTLNARHSADTRAVLIQVGRELFTERGYHGTSADEVVGHARMSKGAMYHHFKNKMELFSAVLVHVQDALEDRLSVQREAFATGDDWERLVYGCRLYMAAASDDAAFRRIVLTEGPAVLGMERWRELQETRWQPQLTSNLRKMMAAGLIRSAPPDALAHVILTMLDDAIIYIAHASDPTAARADMTEATLAMLDGLRPQSSNLEGSTALS